MSLFEEAAAFMKNKTPQKEADNEREILIQKLRHEFENASRPEIEKALDRLNERGEMSADFAEVLKKVRIWLED